MTDFIFNLAMGVMLTTASISFFFAGALVLEWCIRKIHEVEKR